MLKRNLHINRISLHDITASIAGAFTTKRHLQLQERICSKQSHNTNSSVTRITLSTQALHTQNRELVEKKVCFTFSCLISIASPRKNLCQLCKRGCAQNMHRFIVRVNNMAPNRYPQAIKLTVYANICELTNKILLR